MLREPQDTAGQRAEEIREPLLAQRERPTSLGEQQAETLKPTATAR